MVYWLFRSLLTSSMSCRSSDFLWVKWMFKYPALAIRWSTLDCTMELASFSAVPARASARPRRTTSPVTCVVVAYIVYCRGANNIQYHRQGGCSRES